jgi:hypothetical protein
MNRKLDPFVDFLEIFNGRMTWSNHNYTNFVRGADFTLDWA